MGRPGKLWPEESELIQLVREAQRGGPTALDALLTRLRPSFVAYFAPTMGRDDAEDAAQTALLSIVRALPAATFRKPDRAECVDGRLNGRA